MNMDMARWTRAFNAFIIFCIGNINVDACGWTGHGGAANAPTFVNKNPNSYGISYVDDIVS